MSRGLQPARPHSTVRRSTIVGNDSVRCEKEKGTGAFFHSWPFGFLGRPLGRRVNWSPRRLAVRVCQIGEPKGAPRTTQRRMTSRSSWRSGRFTAATQSRGGSTGQRPNSSLALVLPPTRRQRLLQSQHSARSTRPARRRGGLLSVFDISPASWDSISGRSVDANRDD